MVLVVMIVLLVGVVGYFAFKKSSPSPTTEVSNSGQNETPTQTSSPTPSEDKIISDLHTSWVTTQSKFSSKAGESTYNQPSKVQFISKDTLLVYYDDGLVDHISVVQYKNGIFTELKNVGVMSTMSMSEWRALVKTYGDQNFSASSYTTSILRNGQLVNYQTLTKVSENVFVR